VADSRNHDAYFSAEAVSLVVGLSKQKQRKIIDLVERIAASPDLIGDYQTSDAQGRRIEILLLEEFFSPTGLIMPRRRFRSQKSSKSKP